jgi:hypothetical protein
MTASHWSGPLIVFGDETSPPGLATPLAANQNPDMAPSLFWGGVGILDPRPFFAYYPGQAPTNRNTRGWMSADIVALDAAPAAAGTAAIAALQAYTGLTPLTLVSVSGGGITVGSSVARQTDGATVTGLLLIDAAPAATAMGTSGTVNMWDPTSLLARAVTLTSAANLSTTVFSVRGYDIYGMPMTESITGPNANTVTGKKTFKFIASVTPSITSASTVSVGTADKFGIPIRVDQFGYYYGVWDNINQVVAQFTAADTTSPATSTTGDVRGTMTLTGNPSNGTRRLLMCLTVALANSTSIAGLYGVTQYAA